MENIDQRVRAIIVDILCVDAHRAVGSARLIEDLRMDSLDAVEIVMEIEEEFGLEVSDELAIKCLTVQDCINAVKAAKPIDGW